MRNRIHRFRSGRSEGVENPRKGLALSPTEFAALGRHDDLRNLRIVLRDRSDIGMVSRSFRQRV